MRNYRRPPFEDPQEEEERTALQRLLLSSNLSLLTLWLLVYCWFYFDNWVPKIRLGEVPLTLRAVATHAETIIRITHDEVICSGPTFQAKLPIPKEGLVDLASLQEVLQTNSALINQSGGVRVLPTEDSRCQDLISVLSTICSSRIPIYRVEETLQL